MRGSKVKVWSAYRTLFLGSILSRSARRSESLSHALLADTIASCFCGMATRQDDFHNAGPDSWRTLKRGEVIFPLAFPLTGQTGPGIITVRFSEWTDYSAVLTTEDLMLDKEGQAYLM